MLHRYYLLNRPPGIGTFPTNPRPVNVEYWGPVQRIPDQPADHDRHAHGFVEYSEPLSDEDIYRYELRKATSA